jgi:polyhydroxyalkanoate synthase
MPIAAVPIVLVGQAALGHIDLVRRLTGECLDALGAGPQRTPSRLRRCAAGVRLRVYHGAAGTGPAVLLVPAPIKRSYIWDLAPEVSVVGRFLEHGLRVFLAEWTDPGRDEDDFGLEEYADRLLMACVRAVAQETGQQRVVLIGHSLGGTLAAICAARHPDAVAGIVLLESPLHFAADAGAFAPLVALAPHAGWLRGWRAVPGSFLDVVSAAAAPVSFHLDRYLDYARSLTQPAFFATHMRVQRWILDEFALPGRLFEDVIERLYRRDELMAGTLSVTGSRVGPNTLVVPMLNVVNPGSAVTPPQSIQPFHHAAAIGCKALLLYHGDAGVALQHVGVLVGRNAHQQLWPALLRWIDRTCTDSAQWRAVSHGGRGFVEGAPVEQ